MNKFASFLLHIFLLCPLFAIGQVPKGGQVMWLKAGAGVKLDSKGNISNWNDQSLSKTNAAQTALAARPAFVKDELNGWPVARFNGSAYLNCAAHFPVKSDYTLFVVMRINNYGASNTIIGGNALYFFWANYGAAPQMYQFSPGYASSNIFSSVKNLPSDFSTLCVRLKDSIMYFYMNGKLTNSAKTLIANTDNTLNIGAFANGYNFNGDIAEIILYKKSLDSLQTDSVHNYLDNKFNLNKPDSLAAFDKFPQYLQFYARDSMDSATVKIKGHAIKSGYDSVVLDVFKNDTLWQRNSKPLSYSGGIAPFSFNPRIKAGLIEYDFKLHFKNSTTDTVVIYNKKITSGDVYIINGQSNSIFSAAQSAYSNEFVRSFGMNTSFYNYDLGDTSFALASGASYTAYLACSWGIYLAQQLKEKYKVPIFIANGGVGGTPISFHLKNAAMPEDLSTSYGRLLYRMRKAGLDSAVKAIMWYQGESNGPDGYSKNFHQLYKDWHIDYPAIKEIYDVQIHTGCFAGSHLILRELLRTLPDTLPGMRAISSAALPGHDGCHYTVNVPVGYDSLGQHITKVLEKDFYSSADTLNILPPNIKKAFYTDSTYSTIAILFREKNAGISWTRDTSLVDSSGKLVRYNIRHAFYADDLFNKFSKVSTSGDTLKLRLSASARYRLLDYIPDHYYEHTAAIYEGPWLINKRQIGALTFYHFPIDSFTPRRHTALAFSYDSICIGQTTLFTDRSTLSIGTIQSWQWDFGDSSGAAIQNPAHSYKKTGFYNVKLKTYNTTGVTDSTVKAVTIIALPDPTFSINYISGRTYSFVPKDSMLRSYAWDFGDGSLSNKQRKIYTYSADGKYFISLKIKDSNNCRNSTTDTLNVVLSGITEIATKGETNLSISPNPFTESIFVQYTLKQNEFVSIMLYNSDGKLVSTQVNSVQTAGPHSFVMNASALNLKAGIYQLVMLTKEGKITRQVVKL